MTGPHESILGRRIDRVLETTLTGLPHPFDVAKQDVRLNGAIVDVDSETGRATAIERICVNEAEAEQFASCRGIVTRRMTVGGVLTPLRHLSRIRLVRT